MYRHQQSVILSLIAVFIILVMAQSVRAERETTKSERIQDSREQHHRLRRLRSIEPLSTLMEEREIIVPDDEPRLGNVKLNEPEGKKLFAKLLSSEDLTSSGHAIDLLMSLETQMNLGACAPASAVTVLNAMDYKKPYDPTYTMYMSDAYAFWTQTAFAFDPCVKKNLQSHVFGETLEGFGAVMKCLGLNVEVHHGDGSQAFADGLRTHLDANHYVIVNFERASIHEKAGGHFSPLGGFVDGRVLLLDVARYKYSPIFVPIDDIVQAMSRVDLQSGMARGYVSIWKKK